MTKLPKPIHYERHDTLYGRELKDKINEIIHYLDNSEDRLHQVENKNGIQHYEPTKLER